MATSGRPGRSVYTDATHSRVVVEFHSDQNPSREKIVLGPGAQGAEQFGRLLGIRTHKGFDGPSGSFQMIVKKPARMRRQDSLVRIWQDPEDVWVKIFYVVDGQKFHRMTGLVDSIQDSETRVAGGRRIETYTIVGRDIGKVFDTVELWTHIYVNTNVPQSLVAYMNAYQHAPQGKPAPDWIKFLLQTWIGNNGLAVQQWALPQSMGGGSFFDALSLRNLEPQGLGYGAIANGTAAFPDISRSMGKLWTLMEEYSNDLLNEMWVDLERMLPQSGVRETGEQKFGMCLRCRPFITQVDGRRLWDKINWATLEKADIAQRNVSKGGAASRYNFWRIGLDGVDDAENAAFANSGRVNTALGGRPGGVPIWNAESIAKHGVRRWEKSTLFLTGAIASKDPNWPQLAANWLQRVHDWYSVAPMQLSGTIVGSRLFPDIFIGSRLIEKRDEGAVEYYVEGVDDEWQYGRGGSTTFTVTRGQYAGEDLLAEVYRQMRAPSLPVRLEDCATAPIEIAILQNCKFVPQSGADIGEKVLTHGGAGFTAAADGIELPDETELEQAGASPVGAGAALRGPASKQPDPSMVPPQGVAAAQADAIAAGNPAALASTPAGKPYTKAAMERGEDPLAGYDADELNNDPIAGL